MRNEAQDTGLKALRKDFGHHIKGLRYDPRALKLRAGDPSSHWPADLLCCPTLKGLRKGVSRPTFKKSRDLTYKSGFIIPLEEKNKEVRKKELTILHDTTRLELVG